MRYPDSIYATAGNMGKSGTKARLAHLRQQALEKAIRQLELPDSTLSVTLPDKKEEPPQS